MNIAMLCVHTSPLAPLGGKKTGGMNVYVRDLCRELGRRGIHVDVFTRLQDEDTPRIQDGGDNFRVINVAAGAPDPLDPNKVEPHLEQFAENVVTFADEEGIEYDILHAHYWLSGIVANDLRQKWMNENRPIPIIQMFHTLGAMKNEIAPSRKHRAPKIRIEGEGAIIRYFANRIVTHTPAGKAQLIDHYGAKPDKITIIPPGTDTERFTQIAQRDAKWELGLARKQKVVLLVGRIEPLKGIDTFLEAARIIDRMTKPTTVTAKTPFGMLDIAEMDAQKHDVKFIIIGGDPNEQPLMPEMERLLKMQSDLNLGFTVNFVGAKDQDELPLWYSAADIVAMPSHYESFGLVALEAMTMGTPVIASRVGGLQHLVKDGETGFLIDARSAEQLSARLDLLLTDDKLRKKLGKQAQKHAQSYSWPHIADQIIALYRD